MASSCPNCGETDKSQFTLHVTGEKFMVMGQAYVAGSSVKATGRNVMTGQLTCGSCDKTWSGVVDGNHFIAGVTTTVER